MTDFSPPGFLQNPHVQSILASTRLRRLRIFPRVRRLQAATREVVLDCGNGVQLCGDYSAHDIPARGLVTLIHGWEGSSNSTYLLSAASALFAEGYDVFRLNMRDHGPSHHLNRDLFNSTRLDEMLAALRQIHANYPRDWHFLVGFSLGGNFALRMAARARSEGISLNKTIAICPLLDPVKTMAALENGWWLYEKYFVRKWKRSLVKKLRYYPELGYQDELPSFTSLAAMNAYFVPNHTEFERPEDYLQAYGIVGDVLTGLDSPAHVIATQDDPMILAEDLAQLAPSPMLSVECCQFGGHCGFVKNLKLDSWADERVVELINLARYPRKMAKGRKATSES
ncbi:MAG: alpha/beta fold hydrolase [Spongiibacter sp.]|nr:alpha/beta fold hydrolase [Spongiibacter sp.]